VIAFQRERERDAVDAVERIDDGAGDGSVEDLTSMLAACWTA